VEQHPPDHALQLPRPWRSSQGCVELWVVEQVQLAGNLLDHWHSAQHFSLACHNGVGDRVDPKDALQFADVVPVRVVEQGSGCGVERVELGQRDIGQQRAQQHRCQQQPFAAPQNGENRGAIGYRRIARQACPRTLAPSHRGRMRCSCRSVEHHPSWHGKARAGLFVQSSLPIAIGLPA
jgi:hypothetical protein